LQPYSNATKIFKDMIDELRNNNDLPADNYYDFTNIFDLPKNNNIDFKDIPDLPEDDNYDFKDNDCTHKEIDE